MWFLALDFNCKNLIIDCTLKDQFSLYEKSI